MGAKKVAAGIFLATSSLAPTVSVQASETATFTYDALGRLIATSRSGSINNGAATSISYDAAGNRSNYSASGAGPTAPPPPPPSASNTAPTANIDYLAVSEWAADSINVIANDTDADGDYPLTLISVSAPGGGASYYASVESGTTVAWGGSSAGTFDVIYTVRDSRGATSTGTLRVTSISVSTCGNQFCTQ